MRRRWWVLLLFIGLIVGGVLAYPYLVPPPAPPTPPRTATVEAQAIENTVNASGSIAPESQFALVFDTPGTVAQVRVETGQHVKAGEVLAVLDTTDLQIALDQAKQAVVVQQLTAARLQAPPRAEDLAAATAAVAAAEARVTQAKRGPDAATITSARTNEQLAWSAYQQADIQRQAVLDNPYTPIDERAPFDASAGMASVNYQIARYQTRIAQSAPRASELRAAEAQLAQAQSALARLQAGVSRFDVQSSDLQITLTQSQVARAQIALDHATLVAPRAGVITSVNLQVGARTPSDKPALVLVDESLLHLDLLVDEVDVARLHISQPVTVTLDALPTAVLTGTVVRIATLATNTAGVVSYQVRVDLAPTTAPVRVGMTANALIVTERRENVLVVPNWAIRIDRVTGQAYVPVRHGAVVEEVAISLGLRNETVSEALSGVQAGEVIEVSTAIAAVSFFGGPPASPTPKAVTGRTATVARTAIENTANASGALQAEAQFDARFTGVGRVVSVTMKIGQRVQKGDVLAQLDSAQTEIELADAQTRLELARVARARLNEPPTAEEIAASEANLASAQAQLNDLGLVVDRNRVEIARLGIERARIQLWQAQLSAPDEIFRGKVPDYQFNLGKLRTDASELSIVQAQRDYDQARKGATQAQWDAARAQLAQAQAQLDKLGVGPSEEEIALAEAQVDAAELTVTALQSRLKQAVLVAPASGIIAAVNVKQGDLYSGALPAAVIVDDSQFHIDVAVDEIDVAQLVVGQPVTITLDAVPGFAVPGTVAEIATIATNTAGVVSYAVRIELTTLDPALRAGMTANALIVTERREGVLVVPNWAVRVNREDGKTYVPVKRGDKIEETEVTLGLRNETVSEVLSGVQEGDQLEVTNDRAQLSFFGGGR